MTRATRTIMEATRSERDPTGIVTLTTVPLGADRISNRPESSCTRSRTPATPTLPHAAWLLKRL